MARKKRNQTEIDKTEVKETESSAVAVAEPEATTAPEQKEPPAWVDGPPVPLAGDDTAPAELQKTWGNPYKAIFTSTAKGFEMGENRRFKQRVFMFHERPDQSVTDTLKENGFTYRPAEKAWTIQANPDTRRLSEELAQQFAGESQGLSR